MLSYPKYRRSPLLVAGNKFQQALNQAILAKKQQQQQKADENKKLILDLIKTRQEQEYNRELKKELLEQEYKWRIKLEEAKNKGDNLPGFTGGAGGLKGGILPISRGPSLLPKSWAQRKKEILRGTSAAGYKPYKREPEIKDQPKGIDKKSALQSIEDMIDMKEEELKSLKDNMGYWLDEERAQELQSEIRDLKTTKIKIRFGQKKWDKAKKILEENNYETTPEANMIFLINNANDL